MNEINFVSCVLNSRVRVGNDVGTVKFIGEVILVNVELNVVIEVHLHRNSVINFYQENVNKCCVLNS